jgi:KTSC domain
MDPVPVESSLLLWVAYAAGEHRLRLEFRSGEVYDYFDVPAPIYLDLLAAESKGRYFNQHVRDLYRTQRIRGAT